MSISSIMKLVNRMSGGLSLIRSRSSLLSWPVYRANVTGPSLPTNLINSSLWLLARAFIG
ncbi:hypothetical protein AQ946_05620 [Burkholderia pseudomallei]|nr:hypothetical protein AQ766_27315 [Burkholderia pseudomallei]ONE15038.1 hypothetical protein AQ946_05620 [Burkholderia pseudomallei]ONE40756.1 hypothetical protein AQ948_12530 [Burkholderia pseudomallei]ONE41902.1 hypothetical protein AQ947_09995 [Burkholderia pseudomallei]